MSKLIIHVKNWVQCHIEGLEPEDKRVLYDKYSIFIPSARFMTPYKIGRWDGKIHYFQVNSMTYNNLLPEIFQTIDMSKYEVEYSYSPSMTKDVYLGEGIDNNYWGDKVWYKGHRLEGQPIKLEDHQVKLINYLLNHHRCVFSSCTSSGKTIMSAVLLNEITKYGVGLIIVPSTDLCFQSAEEYRKLGLDAGIVGCGLREFGHKIIVCTWQTLHSIDKRKKEDVLSFQELEELKKNLVGVIFDEAHTCKATILKDIMTTHFQDVPIRWGLTGTINKDKSDRMCLVTCIGPVADEKIGAKELQNKGFLSSCMVNCIRLKDDTRFLDYPSEVDYLSSNDERLEFITSIIANVVKNHNNTLVLFGRIVMGEKMEKMLLKKGVDAIFLNGGSSSKKRIEEYDKIKTENNKCLLCTDKIASTGLNIPRLYNLVFLDFGASYIKCIQSLGRGLRLSKDKDHVDVYDISSTTKFSRRHFNERIKYYDECEYPYKIVEVKTWK